jgi:hypothetical protein
MNKMDYWIIGLLGSPAPQQLRAAILRRSTANAAINPFIQ